MRSGDEPRHARSPLGLRLGLAIFGLMSAVLGVAVFAVGGHTGWMLIFAALAVIAAADIALIGHRMRQGPHFQPGRSVPPYAPVESPPSVPRPPRDVTEATRMRRYLILMGICIGLITVAWVFVRLFSTTLAVAMSAVAAVIPPIAVIVANFGVKLPDDDRPE